MECQFCHRDVPGRIRRSVYGEDIWVCLDCYELIDNHRYQPYSQVMDKVAMLAAGYHVNRKVARLRKRNLY